MFWKGWDFEMNWTDKKVTELRELCKNEVSNKEIAKKLKCNLADVHAKRSSLGITIPKVKAGALRVGCRTKEDIEAEIKLVEKAKTAAIQKGARAVNRLVELRKELEGCVK